MKDVRTVVLDGATVIAAACAVTLTAMTLRGGASLSNPSSGIRASRDISNWEQYLRDGRRMGAEDPVLTIIEFGDYECPACRQL